MKFKGILLLLLTSLIWGTGFVAQSVGMDFVEPFTFTCARSLVGGLFLIPVIYFLKRASSRPTENTDAIEISSSDSLPNISSNEQKTLIIGGILCGIALFVASSLQQIGIIYTTSGKAGFITALYIIFVPICGIFLKKHVKINVWVSVIIALAGMYLLCVKDNFTFGKGDLYILSCALGFTIHILIIDHFSPKVDCVKLSCIQFFVCAFLSLIVTLIFESPRFKDILSAAAPILYAGVMSSGVAYTLQIIGQKTVQPAVASLILSMESVFAVLAGWIILGEKLSSRELTGCVLVFAAIIPTQLSDLIMAVRIRKNLNENN